MRYASTDTAPVRLADLMAALSLATDLGMGQPMEFALRACVLSLRLGDALGLAEGQLRDVYYYALLRYIGCTAQAYVFADLFGDEIAMRADYARIDSGDLPEMLGLLFRYFRQANAGAPLPDYIGAVAQGMLTARAVSQAEFAGHCEVAQRFARRMGFSDGVIEALGQLYERWDGKGMPRGLKTEAIALPVRLVVFAQDMVLFQRAGGIEVALAVARKRWATAYDPRVVDVFCATPVMLDGLDGDLLWEAVLTLEPGGPTLLSDAQFDTTCQAMADFADLKSPHTLGHSPKVADLAAEAGRVGGLPAADVLALRRAGWLHEIGRVGISSAIWTKTGTLTDKEREQVRMHPYYTERVLARSAALSRLGGLASLHHERLDGSGYHRGAVAAMLSPSARLLAAANVYQALTEPRPHRTALEAEAAADALRREARAGTLDSDAVHQVLSAAGHRVRAARSERVAGLSEREIEVLRLMARGSTMKQIGQALTISGKTVDNHIQHIYDKIGVSTRAGATLWAVEQQMVE